MSAPDHRPFLVEGDLRTPEDLIAYIRSRAWERPFSAGPYGLGEALSDAEERIDRERRQALVRGAEHFDRLTERLECDDAGQRHAIAQADAFRAAARKT